ncbi:MAG: hypothetical protein QXJ75_04310 [Candidatus Bathyarchaeia archaeon]
MGRLLSNFSSLDGGRWSMEGLRQKRFNGLLREAIDEGLVSTLGESAAKAVYYHLQKNFAFKNGGTPDPEAFAEGLEHLFGYGAKFLEKAILKKLYSKAGINFEEKENYTFTDYVNAAKKKLAGH